MKRIIQSLNILPRWIILVIDLVIITFAVALAYLLRFDFDLNAFINSTFYTGIPFFTLCSLLAIIYTQSYAGIIRFTSIQDGYRIALMTFLATALAFGINYVYLIRGFSIIPRSVIIISFFNSLIFLFAYRIAVKYIFSYFSDAINAHVKAVIYGAGKSGMATYQAINHDTPTNVRVVAFLDDNPRKVGKAVNGVKIYNAETDLKTVLKTHRVDELIIAIEDLSVERTNELVDQCLEFNTKVRQIPAVDKWVKGELSFNQIKGINIEDLLGRKSINLNNIKIREQLKGKCVMVTGAGGSIGSEIVRQVFHNQPRILVLVDQAETPLYEIDHEMALVEGDVEVVPVVSDICNLERMEQTFLKYKPDILIHAAAYKHVPMMENNPSEAIICNIQGTKTVADLSIEHGVEKFVMVSTDKAVNPTNVMGASKRIAEIYVQSLNLDSKKENTKTTAFVTTRFGNVLGSNGSVIPLFKKQIEKGGPITVTDPRITRFFMTIQEACGLTIEAGVMGEGGEIFIIDMGESIKILDLAKKMIMLSGLEIDRDIEIKFTGLRHGEKLYEELLNNKENTIPTHHPKILIAKVREYALEQVLKDIAELIDLANNNDETQVVKKMKQMVPEFISNSSRFEVLDQNVSSVTN